MPLTSFIRFLYPVRFKLIKVYIDLFSVFFLLFSYTGKYCLHIAPNQNALLNEILILVTELLPRDYCSLVAILFLKNFQIYFDIFVFKHCFLACFAYDGLQFGQNHSFGNLCTTTVPTGWDCIFFPFGWQLHYCYWPVGFKTMSISVIDYSLSSIMMSKLN